MRCTGVTSPHLRHFTFYTQWGISYLELQKFKLLLLSAFFIYLLYFSPKSAMFHKSLPVYFVLMWLHASTCWSSADSVVFEEDSISRWNFHVNSFQSAWNNFKVMMMEIKCFAVITWGNKLKYIHFTDVLININHHMNGRSSWSGSFVPFWVQSDNKYLDGWF